MSTQSHQPQAPTPPPFTPGSVAQSPSDTSDEYSDTYDLSSPLCQQTIHEIQYLWRKHCLARFGHRKLKSEANSSNWSPDAKETYRAKGNEADKLAELGIEKQENLLDAAVKSSGPIPLSVWDALALPFENRSPWAGEVMNRLAVFLATATRGDVVKSAAEDAPSVETPDDKDAFEERLGDDMPTGHVSRNRRDRDETVKDIGPCDATGRSLQPVLHKRPLALRPAQKACEKPPAGVTKETT